MQLAEQQRVKTPDAVPGRAHFLTQTEPAILAELTDRVVEVEAGCQTEGKLEKPPPPLFVPQPTGVEMCTQVEDGELFDFDAEIEPILEALVGAACEAAVTEVARERELAALSTAQQAFASQRDAQLAECARLEGEVRRRQEERARRIEQEAARKAAEAAVARKVAAVAFARAFTASLQATVLAQLAEAGHFYDPVRREVESHVLPGILTAVEGATHLRTAVAGVLLDEMLAAALTQNGCGVPPARAAVVRVAEVHAEAPQPQPPPVEAVQAEMPAVASPAAAAAETAPEVPGEAPTPPAPGLDAEAQALSTERPAAPVLEPLVDASATEPNVITTAAAEPPTVVKAVAEAPEDAPAVASEADEQRDTQAEADAQVPPVTAEPSPAEDRSGDEEQLAVEEAAAVEPVTSES